ncbi:MAG TPA: isochorismatase family cysteine hydrolase [Terracidiphilus sp.]|nr:isochorismatase family cysteine hydrolase [Terracidiphilus sp.]
MPAPIPDLSRCAMLSMDLQTSIVDIYAKNQPDLLPRAAEILERAREAGLTVIHVQVGFRPGLPEVSARNPLFGAIRNSVQWQQMFQGPGGAIHPSVAPQSNDIVVTKHRVSAFAGSDLAMILRSREIETLVLFGIATSGVVLSTALEASDADYRLLVVRDCCMDQDEDVHACVLDKIFAQRATVLTADELLGAIGARESSNPA